MYLSSSTLQAVAYGLQAIELKYNTDLKKTKMEAARWIPTFGAFVIAGAVGLEKTYLVRYSLIGGTASIAVIFFLYITETLYCIDVKNEGIE